MSEITERTLALVMRAREREQRARDGWPEFAAFVADYRRVFGECKARQLARDPGRQGVPVTYPLPKKGKR